MNYFCQTIINLIKMQGTLYANPTFISKNIRLPTLISIHPLVAYDEHRLFFNNASIKWEYKDIVNCTFIQSCKILLVLTDDYKIYVFTQHLERITILHNWQPKYIVGFEVLQDLGLMLLIGTEEVEVMKIKIMTNIKRTKFLSSMKFTIKKQYHLSVEPENALKWNRGYGYSVEEDLLYVWSTLDIHFFSLQKLTLRTKIDCLTRKENTLSTVLYSEHYKYTITGMLNGEVKVWRLPTSAHYRHKQVLIHSFSYHSRQIEHIIPGGDFRTIITAGVDMYVCFMSIETFEMLRIFNFSGEYSKIFLNDHLTAYAIKESYLGELNFGNNMEFIAELTGQPIACDRSPHRPIFQEGNYKNIQITLNSNVGLEISLEELDTATELNKLPIKYHYPPLKSQSISQFLSCPFEEDRYFLLTEDGDIFSSAMRGNSGRIDKHYMISKALDSEKHAVNQEACCMRFLHIVPPRIDTEMMEKTVDKQFDSSFQNKIDLYGKLKLLAVGGSRGSLMFFPTEDMSTLYCRVSYHRQQVINIQEVLNKQNKCEWVLTVCEQRYLKLINFEGNRANCLQTIFLGELYISMLGVQQYLLLLLPKGIFQISRFSSFSSEPVILFNRESINHEDDILSLDYNCDLKLLITGSKDYKIKIWTMSKIQIYEIVIDQTLQYVLWGSKLNILVFMDSKMFGLRLTNLKINREKIKKIEQEFKEDYQIEENTTISEFARQALQKMKQKLLRVRQPRRHVSLPDSPEQISKSKLQVNLHRKSLKTELNSVRSSRVAASLGTPSKKKKKIELKTEESPQEIDKLDNELKELRKHIQQLSSIKKAVNQVALPQLKPRKQDIFVEFMRQKLLNKRLLTRRDITLNRIIMKNLIKDHLGSDNEHVNSFKLQ